MRVFRHTSDIPKSARGAVYALGNFDGLHQGHQVVLGEAGRVARAMGVPLAVFLTEPHPVRFFRPDIDPFRLTPQRERLLLLEHFGVDQALLMPFDKKLAGLSAQDFVMDVLVNGAGALHLVVGYDYRFGKGRGGGVDVLSWMGDMEGFGLSVIAPVTSSAQSSHDTVYSSTRIRQALLSGHVREAATLLGHWWGISGRVTRGDQRGRQLNFPTANVELGESQHPKLGVYAVRVRIEDEDRIYDGVANIGRRPTFDKQDVLLEAHLFDCDRDLYDTHVRVELVDFIRPEQKFDGLPALVAQISADCDTARGQLSDPANQRDGLIRPTLDQYLAQNPSPVGVQETQLELAPTTISGNTGPDE